MFPRSIKGSDQPQAHALCMLVGHSCFQPPLGIPFGVKLIILCSSLVQRWLTDVAHVFWLILHKRNQAIIHCCKHPARPPQVARGLVGGLRVMVSSLACETQILWCKECMRHMQSCGPCLGSGIGSSANLFWLHVLIGRHVSLPSSAMEHNRSPSQRHSPSPNHGAQVNGYK